MESVKRISLAAQPRSTPFARLTSPGKRTRARRRTRWAWYVRRHRHGQVHRTAAVAETTGLLQRLSLALLFVAMTSAGFACYAGYAEMVRADDPGASTRHTRRAPRAATRLDRLASSSSTAGDPRTWIGKAETMAKVGAALVFGQSANIPPWAR
jgi:hypothetical protein